MKSLSRNRSTTVSERQQRTATTSASLNYFRVVSIIISSYVFLGFIIFCVSWITMFSFNPSYVQVTYECDVYPRPGAQPDPVKCFIYSVIVSAVFVALVWIVLRGYENESRASLLSEMSSV